MTSAELIRTIDGIPHASVKASMVDDTPIDAFGGTFFVQVRFDDQDLVFVLWRDLHIRRHAMYSSAGPAEIARLTAGVQVHI
jgi:hypothetical protein